MQTIAQILGSQVTNRPRRIIYELDDIKKGIQAFKQIGMYLEPAYEITEKVMPLVTMLIKYMHGIQSSEFDLLKSIGLWGTPGTGKTLTMKIMQGYISVDEMKWVKDGQFCSFGFKIVTSREILSSFAEHGFDGLNKYIIPSVICIDDLGSEAKIGKHYGNELNVIEHLIEERYHYNRMTHFTTNLQESEIEVIYGDRVFSRLIGSTNFIKLTTMDRRKLK